MKLLTVLILALVTVPVAVQKSDHGEFAERHGMATGKKIEIQDQNDNEIRGGKGGARLLIGDSRSRALKRFGNPSEEYDLTDSRCGYLKMHWTDNDYGGDGVYAFFKDGKTAQLKFSSSRYRTADGIGFKSTPKNVRDIYNRGSKLHDLREYVLENSRQEYNGGQDLIFWVDQDRGIAFEFYFDKEQKKRLVWSIEVFDPKLQYLPDACVLNPRKFVKLGQLTLR